MNNLKVVKSVKDLDVIALSNGEFNIGIRATARVLGVSQTAIQKHLKGCHLEATSDAGLSQKTFSLVATHYAYESRVKTPEAKAVARMLREIGAKAYIMSLAGYTFTAHQAKPENYISLEEHERIVSEVKSKSLHHSIVNRHEELIKLVDAGVLTYTKHERLFYKYKLTATGREQGYAQNKNGTVFAPKAKQLAG